MNAAPIPKDTQDFQFKHANTQNVCYNLDYIPIACSLIVADSKRGLLYIAYDNKLTVLKYNGESNNRCAIDYNLPYPISRLSISCDSSYLGVTFIKSTAYIYNASLLSKNTLEILHEVQLSSSSPDIFCYDLRWNPAVSGMFCTVASDHSIGSFQIKVEQKTTVRLLALEKMSELDAMCVAWSPKGKQLVVGCKNGNIVQLKPELKVARTIPGPSPGIGQVIAILWLSNYQFCAAYCNIGERRVNVLIVNAPKGETIANFMSYEDITYGMPDMQGDYLPRYYFDHIPEWNLIIAASSSSSEIAILGSLDNGTNWEQWQLIDSGRAQLPLIRTIETYPIGMTIDRSSIIKLPWGSESTLPNPMPILHIFGTSGQIVSFHMVNLQPNCPSICSPPSESITLISSPQINTMPSEISFNNHPGITSTPRPKQTEIIMEKPKVVPTANLFNKSQVVGNTILTTPKIPPQAASIAPTITQVPTPAPPLDFKIPKVRQDKDEVPSTHKTEPPTQLSTVDEVSIDTPTSDNAIILDETICWRAFQEELIHFEKELKLKLEPQTWQVGTDDERQSLIVQCAEIDEFSRELRETTNSLSNEIAYLKGLLLQSFAWVEEAKSRNSANDSDTSRDRHDRSKIQELQRLATHTQSQLMQAMKALDMQWTEYQLQERSMIKIPSLEFVYQGLKKHSEIILRQKKIIEQQMTKLKNINKGNSISNLNRSIAKLNLNANTSGASSKLNINTGIIEMRCRTIANNTKNFTKEKELKLRDILSHNTPKVIKPITPTPVQNRLEATLSSLASLNTVTSKQKIGKLVPECQTATKTNQLIATSSTSTSTPIQKTLQNPLASLTNIVANIGTSSSQTVTTPQLKSQPVTHSMGNSPLFSTTTSINEKMNTLGNTQLDMKQNVSSQSSSIIPLSLTTQSTTLAASFPKAMTNYTGIANQKVSDTVSSINVIPKEIPQKITLALKPKDTGKSAQPPQPLFDTNLFASSISTTPPSSKPYQPVTYQNQISSSSASNLQLSFKDSLPQVTTTQQSVFSFTNPSSTTITPKATTTPTNVMPTDSIQTFSFASKPLSPPAFSFANSENLSTIKSPPPSGSLDLSSMTVGLTSSNSNDKPTTLSMSSSNSFKDKFAESSTTTLNFGKALLPTSNAGQSQQENKSPIVLPPGTTIEKVGGFNTGALSPTTSASIFGGNSKLSSNIFGASMFGGTILSSALTQAVTLSTANATSTVTSTMAATKIFDTVSSTVPNDIFAQSPATFSNASPLTTFNNSYSNFSSDPAKNNMFDKPLQTAEPSSIFSKSSSSTVPSSTVQSSPFSQTNSPLNTTNLMNSPSTTSTAAPTNLFTNSSNTSNNIIFGGRTNTAIAPPKFSNDSTGSATTSMFGGTATAPSVFGGSIFSGASTFGAQPATPAAAPVFGAAPTFSSKPTFGGQPSMFDTTKPEFNSAFGTCRFGSPPGFGTPPSMGAAPPSFGNQQMGTVFGNTTGSSTFESLAGQSSQLTFDSLAQKSQNAEEPPAFSSGSSFSSWR